MNCPICKKELTPQTDANGVTRAFCDCIGFLRPVIEVIPPENAEVRMLNDEQSSSARVVRTPHPARS